MQFSLFWQSPDCSSEQGNDRVYKYTPPHPQLEVQRESKSNCPNCDLRLKILPGAAFSYWIKEPSERAHIPHCCIHITLLMAIWWKISLSRKTGSRCPISPKSNPTIWDDYLRLHTKFQNPTINSLRENFDGNYYHRRTDWRTDGPVKNIIPSATSLRGV